MKSRASAKTGARAAAASIATSYRNKSSGFTLIELLLVLGIVAAVLVVAGRRTMNRPETPASVVRKFALLTRQLNTQAKLQKTVFRLVISKGEKSESGKDLHAYWVERSTGEQVLLDPSATPDKSESKSEKDEDDEDKDDKDKPAKKRPFVVDSRILKEPIVLPPNLQFKQVETEGYEKPIEEGRAYIHFFPQGLIEEGVIQLTNEKGLEWTLAIHPLTGKTDLIKKHLDLEDIRKIK